MTELSLGTATRTSGSGMVARYYPGVLIALVGGISAEAISLHYGAPAMLIALLIGLAIHFTYDLESVRSGIEWAGRSVLRFGVALLGLRIALSDIGAIGGATLSLVAAAMAVTVLCGVWGARLLGLTREFGVLSGGAVAVCGASAAAAISSVLPRDKDSEQALAVVIAVVTVMATIAMIAYPLLLTALSLGAEDMGVVLGGTIHDVAQVVAAGKAISPRVGELATLVKLMRVALLLPVVVLAYVWLGRGKGSDAPKGVLQYIPGFLLLFFAFAALNSMGWVPDDVATLGGTVSHWCLVIAITAIGVKTNLKSLLDVGWRPFVLIVAETLVMLAIVLGGVIIIAML